MTSELFGLRADLLIPLLAGHLLGDFVLQPGWMVKEKSEKWGVLLEHSAIVAVDGRQLRLEHLERNLAFVLQVVGQVDRDHAAPAELALELLACVVPTRRALAIEPTEALTAEA